MTKLFFILMMLLPVVAVSQPIVFPNVYNPDTTLFAARVGTDSSIVVRYSTGTNGFIVQGISITADTAWADSMDIEFLVTDTMSVNNVTDFQRNRIVGRISLLESEFKGYASGNKKILAKTVDPLYIGTTKNNGVIPIRIVWRSSTAKAVGKRMVLTISGRQY